MSESICKDCKHKGFCDETSRLYGLPNIRIQECKEYEQKECGKNAAIDQPIDIVRCGECRWYNCEACFRDVGAENHRNTDDFCSYGERKEGADMRGEE